MLIYCFQAVDNKSGNPMWLGVGLTLSYAF